MDPYRQRFFITAESPCPYIKGKEERKLFTRLSGPMAHFVNNELNQHGFRRSQGISYRPACEDCSACHSIRVCVDEFTLSRSFRRTLGKNDDLVCVEKASIATAEQFTLLSQYLHARHSDGDMAMMDEFDYAAMVEDTPIDTRIYEYRDANDDHLIAACITDRLEDGLSMVYSYFSPEDQTRSLGGLMVLDHIKMCQDQGLSYLYLGYWIKDCDKMSYKKRFQPAEILTKTGWTSFEDAQGEAIADVEPLSDSENITEENP